MVHRKRILSILAVALVGGLIALAAAPALALGLVPDTGVDVVRGKVFSLVETSDHSTIYIGGKFSRVSDQAGSSASIYNPASITRFNESTGLGDPTWTPGVYTANQADFGTVNGMALSPDGSTLYVVGKFALACPSPVGSACETRKNLAAFDTTTGALLPLSENIANSVNTVLLGSSGGVVTKIYLGGPFKRLNGKPVGGLAALNPDGSVDPSWNPVADNTVRTLVYSADGSQIFVGGSFTSITQGGTTYPRQSVARLNLDGTVDGWSIPGGVLPTPMTAWSLTPSPDGTILYGGFGAGPNFAAAFSLADGTQIWKKSTPGNVEGTALSPDGTGLFISGHFGTAHKTQPACTGESVHGLAELDLLTAPKIKYVCWAPHMFPDSGNFTGGWTIVVNSTYLWVGGLFDRICTPDGITQCVPAPGGTGTMNIARFTL